ncbi:cation:proton antiporter [Microbacterium sp.]|uniref:cation:proton antiporter n=1 Tax=Microbacterium sp. TaxID=51671 RepID=UPI002812764F|nr:cation:proton antiporter [Microbacterium sp.]
MELDSVGLLYFAASIATLVAALLPRLLRRAPISMPILFVAAGVGAFALFPDLPDPDPIQHPEFALHLTELCVIVSLMGAGLAINRRFQWRTWSTTWRLLAITMPLSILAVALLGWWALGLGIASAALLAAALSPTDPVLASEVQVSEPLTEDESGDDDEARFAVTSEAGLNDGLAFPFTYAAIAISTVGLAPSGWLGQWLLIDVLWRLAVGVVVGLGTGWLLRRVFFSAISQRLGITDRADGFIALGATFLAYGAAEVAEGYGFIAVFVCACTIRAGEQAHGLHSVLHTFVEQIERLLTVVVLVLLGGAVARGLLESLTPADYLFAAVLLLVIRPVTGWLALTPGKTGPRERAVISFFGVRGVGSLFYIAYALQHGDFPGADRLWAVVSLVILGSVLIHGVAATPSMVALDRARRRRATDRGDGGAEVDTPV